MPNRTWRLARPGSGRPKPPSFGLHVADDEDQGQELAEDPGAEREADRERSHQGQDAVAEHVHDRRQQVGEIEGDEAVGRLDQMGEEEAGHQERDRCQDQQPQAAGDLAADHRENRREAEHDQAGGDPEGEGEKEGVGAERRDPLRVLAGEVDVRLIDPDRSRLGDEESDRGQEGDVATAGRAQRAGDDEDVDQREPGGEDEGSVGEDRGGEQRGPAGDFFLGRQFLAGDDGIGQRPIATLRRRTRGENLSASLGLGWSL